MPSVSPSVGMPVSAVADWTAAPSPNNINDDDDVSLMLSNELQMSTGCSEILCNSWLSCVTKLSEPRHQDSLSVPPRVLFRSVFRVANPTDQWPLCCSFTSKYDLDWTSGAVANAPPDPQMRQPPLTMTTSWPIYENREISICDGSTILCSYNWAYPCLPCPAECCEHYDGELKIFDDSPNRLGKILGNKTWCSVLLALGSADPLVAAVLVAYYSLRGAQWKLPFFMLSVYYTTYVEKKTVQKNTTFSLCEKMYTHRWSSSSSPCRRRFGKSR